MVQEQLLTIDGYVLDSNCIIPMFNEDGPYPQDLFPSLKGNMEKAMRDGTVVFCKEVITELGQKDDGAQAWVKIHGNVIDFDEGQDVIVREILRDFEGLIDITRENEQADPFVIALAESQGLIVVTEEKFSTKAAKPKIPNVCEARDIKCISLRDFFRRQKWTF